MPVIISSKDNVIRESRVYSLFITQLKLLFLFLLDNFTFSRILPVTALSIKSSSLLLKFLDHPVPLAYHQSGARIKLRMMKET